MIMKMSVGSQYTFNNLASNTYIVGCRLYFYETSDYCDTAISDPVTLSGSSSSTYAITIRENNYTYGEAWAFESWAAPGDIVDVDATAYPGYQFIGWSASPSVQFGNYLAESTYFIMPSSDVTITANFVAATQTRPKKFSWTNGTYNPYADVVEKVQGNQYDLTAAEWNSLCDNVKKVGAYANGKTYNFLTAYPRNTFYYYMYNEVARAIEEILLYNSYNVTLPTVKSGDAVKAADLNILMNAINLVQ